MKHDQIAAKPAPRFPPAAESFWSAATIAQITITNEITMIVYHSAAIRTRGDDLNSSRYALTSTMLPMRASGAVRLYDATSCDERKSGPSQLVRRARPRGDESRLASRNRHARNLQSVCSWQCSGRRQKVLDPRPPRNGRTRETMRARAIALLLIRRALVDGAAAGHRRRSDPPALPLALAPDHEYWRCAASANRTGCAIEEPYGVLNLSAPIPLAEAHLGLVHRPHPALAAAVGSNASADGDEEDEGEPREWWRRRLAAEGVNKPSDAADEDTPLFQGIGTHYANIFVGVPPQRVSVIVDTGSHHTAFPCTGCKQCGKHTDPYFDPDHSETQNTLSCDKCEAGAKCTAKRCQLSQSYTEGSSWKAYQVRPRAHAPPLRSPRVERRARRRGTEPPGAHGTARGSRNEPAPWERSSVETRRRRRRRSTRVAPRSTPSSLEQPP